MEQLLHDWGYLILFLYSFGGGFLALAVAGVLSYTGDLNLFGSMTVAATANTIGDQFLFYIARNNKEQAKNMMGKYHNYVVKTENMMIRFGSFAILIQKYIYGIKTLIPLVIGLTTYDAKKFFFFNAMGAIIWAVVVGYLSFSLGQIVIDSLEEFKNYGLIIALVIIVLVTFISRKL
ncbi:MAG: DedA family protein [Campylobacterales bacterium]|nr:DedA family protein [Campylobacterales bacterium]